MGCAAGTQKPQKKGKRDSRDGGKYRTSSSKRRSESGSDSGTDDDLSGEDEDGYVEPSKQQKRERRHRIKAYRRKVLEQANAQRESLNTLLRDEVVTIVSHVLEAAPVAAVLISSEGAVLNLNAKALELFEHNTATFKAGNHFSKLLKMPASGVNDSAEQGELRNSAEEVAVMAGQAPVEAVGVDVDGTAFRILVRGSEAPMGEHGGFLVFVEQIPSSPTLRAVMSPDSQPLPRRPSPILASPMGDGHISSPNKRRVPGRRSVPHRRLVSSPSRESVDAPSSPSETTGKRRPSEARQRRLSVDSASEGGSATSIHSSVVKTRDKRLWLHGDVQLTVNQDGKVLGLTHGAVKLLGVSPEEARGRCIDTFIASVQEMEGRSLKEFVQQGEAAMLRAEEDRRFLIRSAGEAVELVSVGGICEVVPGEGEESKPAVSTVRLQMVEQHRAKKRGLVFSLKGTLSEDMAAVFEHTPGASVVTAQSGDIVYLNELALQLLEYDMDELHNEDVSVIVPHPWKDAHPRGVAQLYLDSSKSFFHKPRGVCMITKRPRIIPVRLELSELVTPQGKVLYVCNFRILADRNLEDFPGLSERLAAARADDRNSALAVQEERKLRAENREKRKQDAKRKAAVLAQGTKQRARQRRGTTPRQSGLVVPGSGIEELVDLAGGRLDD
eukprot:TRINITY_DN30339_c0_g1_i1.p1 TRINITY_DN30339_c0_g1~~TRINITY_DN30339_c0_g1_i1.p1  ORF type:complete len:669 (+),score=238.43 TRINITY_DN30339_c0_g1_i1:92-2098(+)